MSLMGLQIDCTWLRKESELENTQKKKLKLESKKEKNE